MADTLESTKTLPGDVEAIAQAISKADAAFGYSLSLTRLVDGVSTYTLTMNGYEPYGCEDTEEAYSLIADRRNRARAEVLATLKCRACDMKPANPSALDAAIAELEAFERDAPILDEIDNWAGFWESVMLCMAELKRLRADPAPKTVSAAPAWTDATPPNGECPYDHCACETPLGTALIAWKSWKDYPSYTLTVDDEWIDTFHTIDEAKNAALAHVRTIGNRCSAWISSVDTPAQAEADDVQAKLDEYRTAWEALFGPLTWMQHSDQLTAYAGWGLSEIANDLIDRAYPGLRSSAVAVMEGQTHG